MTITLVQFFYINIYIVNVRRFEGAYLNVIILITCNKLH